MIGEACIEARSTEFRPGALGERGLCQLLEITAPRSPRIIARLAVDMLPLIPAVVVLGGGPRLLGLGRARYGTQRLSVEPADSAVSAIQQTGDEPPVIAEISTKLVATGWRQDA